MAMVTHWRMSSGGVEETVPLTKESHLLRLQRVGILLQIPSLHSSWDPVLMTR